MKDETDLYYWYSLSDSDRSLNSLGLVEPHQSQRF